MRVVFLLLKKLSFFPVATFFFLLQLYVYLHISYPQAISLWFTLSFICIQASSKPNQWNSIYGMLHVNKQSVCSNYMPFISSTLVCFVLSFTNKFHTIHL